MEQNVVLKLEKKYPNSEIIIRQGEIFIKNPATGFIEFYGKMTRNSSEILQKNPLFKSSSWVNVANPGIENFSSFGKIPGKEVWSAERLGRFLGNKIVEYFKSLENSRENDKMRDNKNTTFARNINDTGNFRGEILGKTDTEIHRKEECGRIIISMKNYEEKIIPII